MIEHIDAQQDFSEPAEIMVIDDTPANLRMLIQLLNAEGYRIRPSVDGAEALRSIQEETPDLILLDILMPGISGYDVCESLKADERTRDVPVIFISSMNDTEDKLKAFELGGVDYITKPIQQQEVLARVKTHLDLRHLQLQLQEENERFHRLEEATFEGLLIHRSGWILDVNQVICQLVDSSRDELLGRHLLEFVPAEFHDTMKRRIAEEDGSSYELEALRRDGTRISIETHSKTLPWQGRAARVLAVRDLSERRTWEQKTQALESENISLRAGLSDLSRLDELVGRSPSMQKTYERLIQAAASQEITMIYGETGSGKELAARTIFHLSDHHTKVFVAVNCGAVPESLFESQFFGYRKGAFTGAFQDSTGFFGDAEGGTLFLDEVGELSLPMQIKLLRVLNDGYYTPVGATRPRQADIRMIAATNRELRDMVKEGTLREDFFHRLHIIAIDLPPLRRRKEDIPLLIEHFADQEMPADSTLRKVPAALLTRFQAYDWPGNVRELFNELRRWHVTGEVELAGKTPAEKHESLNLPFLSQEMTLTKAVRAFEQYYVNNILDKYDGQKSKAAKVLGVSRKTIYNKLETSKE